MEEKAKEPLKVLDRRKFTADGERREGAEFSSPEPEAPSLPHDPPAAPAEAPSVGPSPSPSGAPAASPPAFGLLVQDLAQSCAFHLGLIPDPATGRPRVDLQSAGLYLDFLEAIQSKTKGNLDAQEQHLLDDALFQLKVLFTKARARGPAS